MMKNEFNDTIGSRFRMVRKHEGLKQKDFCRELGIVQQAYSRIENNRRPPTIEVLNRVSEKFRVNLNWLITGHGEIYMKTPEVLKHYLEKTDEIKSLITRIADIVSDLE